MSRLFPTVRSTTIAAGFVAGAAAALTLLPRRGPDRQIVLITGGAGGLGMALARRWARANARLILNGRNPNELERERATSC